MPVRTTIDLPEHLHHMLRKRAEQSGTSIRVLIVDAIEQIYGKGGKGAYVSGPLVTGAGMLGRAFPKDENPHDVVFS